MTNGPGRFRFRAATASGELREGVLRAPSARGALEELRRQALHPVSLEAADVAAPAGRASRREAVALWMRTLATLLASGMALDRALEYAGEQVPNAGVRSAARAVHADVRGGASLAAAMRRHPRSFASLDVAIVAAGEEGGALDATMARLATHLEESGELWAQVGAALVYPALMSVVTVAGVAVLLLVVVPRFVAMLGDVGGTLPLSTRVLVGASAFATRYWWLALLAAAGAVLGARRWLAQAPNRRRWHDWRRRLPVVGELETGIATARFTRTFGMLLGSGVAMLPALRIATTVIGNAAMADEAGRASLEVARGRRVGAALSGVLPPLACQLVSAGEESGQLDTLSIHAADAYDAAVRRSLRTLTGLVEPALVLVFGALIGFVALAMLQAIYSVNARLP